MLCEFQKVTPIGLLNETKAWENKPLISSCCHILLNSALGTNLHLIICAGNFIFVQGDIARMQVFTLQK